MSGYTLYGGELSLFTRKLEAALQFYGARFELTPKTPANGEMLELRSGTHQVPVLQTPENWMIADTTPIMMLLDGRFPERAMFPEGHAGVVVHLIEEYLDEWVARVMVHWRWHYPESAQFAANRMANGNQAIVERMLDWGPRACRATGTDSEHQQRAAEAEYERLLAGAEAQLQETDFLLGNRPTAADCIFLGGLRAHTNMDPVPKRVVAEYPTVKHWAEERANVWQGGGELLADPEQSAFAQQVFTDMSSTYGAYVLGNKAAQEAGAKAFHVPTYGEETSYLSRPYPEQSRQMVVRRLGTVAEDDLLERVGLTEVFSR